MKRAVLVCSLLIGQLALAQTADVKQVWTLQYLNDYLTEGACVEAARTMPSPPAKSVQPFICQKVTRVTVTQPTTPPPTCSTQPSETTQTIACPAGFAPPWQQTTTVTVSPPPACVVTTIKTPSTAPATACLPVTPPSSSVKARVVPTRTSGTAPLAVMFDATSTTSTTAGLSTFRQISYVFNFDDDRGQTWTVSGKPKNTEVGGPLAAHVFDLPGTYVVKLRATDPAGAFSDTTVTITVSDPNVVYAGTKTVCVSPTSNYSGCPSGSAQQTNYPSTWNGKRVLLHRGESFGAISIQDGNTNVQVGAYGIPVYSGGEVAGKGANDKPVVPSIGIGNTRPNTTVFPTDITVAGLNVQNGIQQTMGSRVLLYRNEVHAVNGNVAIYIGQVEFWQNGDCCRVIPKEAFYNARELFLVENVAIGETTPSGPQVQVFGDGSRVALLGNVMGRQQQHTVRLTALNRGVLAHNNLQGISADGIRLALKLHSMGLNPYADSSLNDSTGRGGWASNLIVISNNVFGSTEDNNAWTIAIAPQNETVAEGIEDAIVENNKFARGPKTTTDAVVLGRRLTGRGNATLDGRSMNVGTEPNDELPPEWIGPYYEQ